MKVDFKQTKMLCIKFYQMCKCYADKLSEVAFK